VEEDVSSLQIATVGEDTDPIMVAIRELPVSRLVLIYTSEAQQQVDDLINSLSPLKLEIDTIVVQGDPLLGVIREVTKIVTDEGLAYDSIYVNVSSGSKMLSCSALSAAFVNGVKAVAIKDDMIIQLPVLKFNYSELISEAKLKILDSLKKSNGEVDSLQQFTYHRGLADALEDLSSQFGSQKNRK